MIHGSLQQAMFSRGEEAEPTARERPSVMRRRSLGSPPLCVSVCACVHACVCVCLMDHLDNYRRMRL